MSEPLVHNLSECILLVDDDPMIHYLVQQILPGNLRKVDSLNAAREVLSLARPKLLLVDIFLGDAEYGLDLIPLARQLYQYLPIIVLTGDKNEDLISDALAVGANDFIQKPLKPKELKARVSARIKEANTLERREVLTIGDMAINRRYLTLQSPGQKVAISLSQCNILELFCDKGEEIVSRSDLTQAVWGATKVSENTIDHKVTEVRSLLRSVESKWEIKSIYGRGFVLKRVTS